MISHSEAVNIWLGAFGTAAFIGGLLSGHWWWPLRQRLEDEWDDGHGVGRDEGYWAGYAIGVDDEARGLAYVYDEAGNEIPAGEAPGLAANMKPRGVMPAETVPGLPELETAPRPDDRPSGSEVAGPGRAEPAYVDEWGNWAQGRTYSELVMLSAQDEPELPGDAEPGDWYPEALRRSEDWLAECRAELGLVAS